MQGYQTLEEAAQFLSMDVDELRQMAQKNQIRSFQDRGTLRFRMQDVQELARQRGMASDIDEPLGGPPTTPRTPRVSQLGFPSPKDSGSAGPEVFDFSSKLPTIRSTSAATSLPRAVPRAARPRKPGSKPTPGSDSDVRLISDQEMALNVGSDSDIRLVGQDSAKIPPLLRRRRARRSVWRAGTRLAGQAEIEPGRTGVARQTQVQPGRASFVRSVDARQVEIGWDVARAAARLQVQGAGRSGHQLHHRRQRQRRQDRRRAGSDEIGLGKTILGPTDSDIRLQRQGTPAPSASDEGMLLTEEINLDEEIRKQEEALKQKPPQAKVRPKSKLPPGKSGKSQLPPGKSQLTPGKSQVAKGPSPFELSDHDSDHPAPHTPPRPQPVADKDKDSSDFDLVPSNDGSVEVRNNAEDDFSLELPDDSDRIELGAEASSELQGPTSGINPGDPIDAGISLELATPRPSGMDSSDEFEINLDDSSGDHPSSIGAAESDFEFGTAKPSSAENPALESDSEFEIGVPDISSGESQALKDDSDSEFELTLDASSDEVPAMDSESPLSDDSDSEFELTLDDSGNLAADGEEQPAETDKDIFESDFEVPGLEDESGSQVAALDTDLESSDFEVEEDESGSQVVALDDEEYAEGDETIAAPAPKKKKKQSKARKQAGDDDDSLIEDEDGLGDAFGDLEADEDFEIDSEPVVSRAGAPVLTRGAHAPALRPAPWGVLPSIVMFPCLIVMILGGMLSFEQIQTNTRPGAAAPLTQALTPMMQSVLELVGMKK